MILLCVLQQKQKADLLVPQAHAAKQGCVSPPAPELLPSSCTLQFRGGACELGWGQCLNGFQFSNEQSPSSEVSLQRHHRPARARLGEPCCVVLTWQTSAHRTPPELAQRTSLAPVLCRTPVTSLVFNSEEETRKGSTPWPCAAAQASAYQSWQTTN